MPVPREHLAALVVLAGLQFLLATLQVVLSVIRLRKRAEKERGT
jgi:hypothetical protein